MVIEIQTPYELLQQSPLPKQFLLDGKRYFSGSSSANSVASILTGDAPLGNLSYINEFSEHITVWIGLLSDLSFKPFAVLEGDSDHTKEQAKATYDNLVRLGI